MARKDIEAGRAFVKLDLRKSQFVRDLQAASQRLTTFGGNVMKIGGGISATGGAMLAPLLGAVTQFAERGSELNKIAAQTGNSVESVSRLAGAAAEFGIEIDDVTGSMEELNIRLGEAVQDGTGPLADTFTKLGMDAKAFAKLPVTEQYEKLADVLAGIENRSERQFIADEIFGGDAMKIMPLLEQGGAKLANQLQNVSAMSAEEAAAAAELKKVWNQLLATFNSVVMAIGGALAPTVTEILTLIKSASKPIVDWIKENRELVKIVAAVGIGLVVAGGAVTAFGLAAVMAGMALGGIATVIGAIGSVVAFLVSPLGLVTAALVGGVTAWAMYTESGQTAMGTLRQLFGSLLETGKKTFGGIRDALAAGDLALAGKIAVAGLKLAVLQGLAALASLVGGVWGDTIKAIGGDLLKGDFTGAWNTALSAMGAAWADWSAGVVKTFASVVNSVVSMWEAAVNRIAKYLVEQAASEGVVGTALSKMLGVDMRAEKAQSEHLERERREGERRRAQRAVFDAEDEQRAAYDRGDLPGARIAQRKIDEAKANLAKVEAANSGEFDGLDAARDAIDQHTGATADAMRGFFDGLADQAQRQAEETETEHKDKVAPKAGAFDQVIASAQADLDAARKEAAKKAAEARKASATTDEQQAAGGGAAAGVSSQTAVSFSAAALSAIGQGSGSPQEQLVKLSRKQEATLQEIAQLTGRQLAKIIGLVDGMRHS